MLKASSGERYRASMSNGSATGQTRSGQTRSLAAQPEGSMIATEPRS
jgi:hypothetical protein